MRSMRNWVIFIFIAALAAFTIYDTRKSKALEEEKDEAGRVVRFKEADIRKVELLTSSGKGDRKIVLEKDGEHWFLREPLQDSADDSVIESFLSTIRSEKSQSTIAEGANVDLTIYGLEKPPTAISVTSNDGSVQNLQFGSIKAYDGSLYAKDELANGSVRIRLVNSTFDDYATKPVDELRNRYLYRGELDKEFTEFHFLRAEPAADLRFKKIDKRWILESEPETQLSQIAVDAFIDRVKDLQGASFTPPEKLPRGLPAVSFELTSGKETFALKLYPDSKNAENAIATSSDLARAGKPVIVLDIPKASFEPLLKTVDHFFDRQAPFRFDSESVTRIEIRAPRAMPPVAFSAEKSGKTWKISAPEAEGSGPGGLQGDLDSTKLDLLLQRLVKLETVKFLDPVKSSAERVDSLIRASDATGKVVFEMEWGLSILRKQMDGLEIHMVPARTSLANRWLGLTESSITELKLRELRNSSAE